MSDHDTGPSAPVYAYRQSLMGGPLEFRLAADALEWQAGRHAGRVPYDRITRMRLSYRPATMQSHRFLAEIWSPGNPRLTITSTTWKGMLEQARQDAAYASFMAELHRRLVAAGSKATFLAGSPIYLYWPGVAVLAGAGVMVAFLIIRALLDGAFTGAAIIGGILLILLWQIGSFFYRNWPARYQPEAPPERVLPRG